MLSVLIHPLNLFEEILHQFFSHFSNTSNLPSLIRAIGLAKDEGFLNKTLSFIFITALFFFNCEI